MKDTKKSDKGGAAHLGLGHGSTKGHKTHESLGDTNITATDSQWYLSKQTPGKKK